MTTVDRVKSLCKERKIPISKLEKDLGFSNGYIGQLRKGTFPDDRLRKIAIYFNVSVYELTGEEQQKKAPAEAGALVNNDPELTEYLEELKNRDEMRMLFKLAKNATKADVMRAVAIIEALRKEDED